MEKQALVYERGKVPGLPFDFGSVTYILPPLNIAALEQHDEAIHKIQADGSSSLREKMGLICAVALSAFQRNYPEMKLEFLKEHIDLRNMGPLFQAVMGMSGFVEAKPGEGEASELTGPK